MTEGNKKKGVVKWFSDEKGYGFIESSEGGEEFFVHSTQVMDGSLAQGQRVEFEVGEGKKGPAAQNVTSDEE